MLFLSGVRARPNKSALLPCDICFLRSVSKNVQCVKNRNIANVLTFALWIPTLKHHVTMFKSGYTSYKSAANCEEIKVAY